VRKLIVTATGEAFQPVRLTYQAPAADLRKLGCVGEDAKTGQLCVWLSDEALEHTFGPADSKTVAAAQPAGQRLILGTVRQSEPQQLSVEVRSVPRAIELARLLTPALGEGAVLQRVRVVNRWFDADEPEGSLEQQLERDVTVVDPDQTERELRALLDQGKTVAERRAAWRKWGEHQRQLDVPLVEDYPTLPEEDLAMGLNLRFARCSRRWFGENVTLGDVIYEMVESGQLHAVPAPATKEEP
jgi:hypothetical protein